MTTYSAPVSDMKFVLHELAGLDEINQLPAYGDATPDMVDAILEEAARLAQEVLLPINKSGDEQGARIEGRDVIVADGFKEAYEQFIEGGWPGLQFSADYDGQGLPALLQMAVSEMWYAANMSFSLAPLLTQGAIEAIEHHGSEELKATYLSRMISGEWTGTMNLTEPQAGSDLSAVNTKAIPEEDHYRIVGQKIYITYGDHDMTDNIIHLVLARTPDAPPGVKGISLFIVPKYLAEEDGSIGKRNDVEVVSLEHKLGVKASPTCAMSFGDSGGAVGYLVGEENKGLAYMFTMMNNARLNVGLESVAVAERAYQQARDYAKERVQGQAPGSSGKSTIIAHPDIRRMLLLMRSLTEAGRALAYTAMAHGDRARFDVDETQRAMHQSWIDLLTPVVKGWFTEMAQEVTYLGVQVHGGMGYVEETGVAQHARDARVTTIYEGTTGIQALDLIGRKMLRDRGAGMELLFAEIDGVLEGLSQAGEVLSGIREALSDGLRAARDATQWILAKGSADPSLPGAAAFNYLMLVGTVCGMWQMAMSALTAAEKIHSGDGDARFYGAKQVTARFYAEQVLPRIHGHLAAIKAGQHSIMALEEDQF